MTATIIYEGDLRCTATHIQSGITLETDAPTDNRGKGERFSPTDLTCASLATCIVTTMGLKAADMEIDLRGTRAEVTKHMLGEPRRIGKIEVSLVLPGANLGDKEKQILQRVGDNCPVAKSLHPDIEVVTTYSWTLDTGH